MTKVKAIQIVEDLKIGGAERVIESIALGLDRNIYSVEVWCLTAGGKVANRLIQRGITVKVLRLDSYYNPVNIIRLSMLLKRSRARLIHTHGYFASTFARLAAILVRPLIIIIHVHTTHYGLGLRNRTIERLLSIFTDKVICISKSVRDFVIREERINAAKTALVYNGIAVPDGFVDDFHSKSLLKKIGLESNHKIIITVASLQPHKGHKVLIEAFNEVLKKNPKARLLIIGEGPLKEYLSGYVDNKGLSRFIVFLGEQENVYQFLSIAHLFVLSSVEREGLGLALIEAMAMKLPVVGSNLGGIKELIEDGINGRLFRSGDSLELANAIHEILNDNETSRRLGSAGRKRFEKKFQEKQMIESIGLLYHNLLLDADASRTI